MLVLCAPNAFKGTLTAVEAAEAMARGARRAGARAVEFPVADGGDGTAAVLGGRPVRLSATGPFGERLRVEYRMRAGGEAVIDVAQVGLARTRGRDPLRARSDGLGEMMADALRRGARRLVVALGGSATVDGGAGMARALGVRFLDRRGRPWTSGGPPENPAAVDACGLDPRWRDVRIDAACDVRTPFGDCARVFGPQKGASPADVAELSKRLRRMAAIADPEIARRPGSGAAGGIGWALAALFGARLRPGAKFVLAATGFRKALAKADLVLTGEGKWDATTRQGKAPWAVVAAAEHRGVPVVALCGVVEGHSRVARELGGSRGGGMKAESRRLEKAAEVVVGEVIARKSRRAISQKP
ncbi:MAG: glycerate kinase [Planctomycetes bacterium]|nr:glycerate kinase [Planctomycetota bacterium]